MIDVHIINTDRPYRKRCVDSLSGEPINLFEAPFIKGRIGKARVNGIKMGTSEFVSFVDDDDILVPGAFTRALDILQQGFSAYYSNHYVMDVDGKVYGRWFDKPAKAIGFSQETQMHHIVVYRRELIEPVFAATELALYKERTLFNLASIYHGRVFGDDRMGLYWRVHEDSAHTQVTAETQEWKDEVKRYRDMIMCPPTGNNNE